MQKPTNRILSALLVLVMVLSMLPATVFAASETDALEGWNLALGENIGVKFYLNSADYTVTTTVNGVEVNPTISEKVVTVNVAAAQMTDTIGLTVKSGDETVHTGEYSVRQYAETILNGKYDAEVKELVKEMLNYGAAAQTYFEYKATDLANKDYELATAATVPTEIPEITAEGSVAGISLYGMSLVFQSKTAVRFYFNVSGNISDYTFKVGETAYVPVEKNGQYYVEVGNINPQDLDKVVTVTVNDALSVSYSPLNYIVRKYNNSSSSDSLKALVQAMYGYHLEALDYQEYLEIIQVGTLKAHDNNTPWVKNENETYIYFNTDAYTATTGEYTSLTADAIKLVRGGEVYSVANPGQGLLVKDNDTQHLLKLTPWGITGGHMPIQAHDYFIIEGRFESTSGDGTTIQIATSYIYYNGTNVEVSTTVPILPTTIDAGMMSAHSTTGWKTSADADGNLLFAMADNDAPSGYYRPTDASNVQLIRDGNTYVVGHNLRDTIAKENNAQYVFEFWTVEKKPMQANDILVVEGSFYQESTKTTLNISKTYILLNADGTATFSAEMPTLPTTIDAGTMSSHPNGINLDKDTGLAKGIYFKMAENDATITGWSGYYRPLSADNFKLIRDGQTYTVGNTGHDLFLKYSATEYYFRFEDWMIGDKYPITQDDILVVEGSFYHAASKVTLNITKTYIYYDGSAWVFSATEPVISTIVDCGTMSEHADGSASEIYFSLAANAVPVDEETAYPYSGSVQLVQGGETSSIDADIYKLADDQYYLDLFGVKLADGDYLIVEGAFSNADNGYTLNITKTYVLVDGESLVYSESEPVLDTEIAIGALVKSDYGIQYTTNETLIYATGEANAAPYGDGVEYTPVSAGGLKLIRDGVTYEVGNVGQGIIIHSSETQYCVKLAAWTVTGNKLPVQKGDIFVVEGKYTKRGDSAVVVNFATTYILIAGENEALFFTEQPNVVYAGAMTSHSTARTANGFYAKTAANNAPFEGWSLRYKPVTSDAVKCVIGDATTNVANTGGEMLVKYSDSEYFIEGWTLSGTFKGDENNPVDPVGNIYIFDGLFYNAANDVYIDIDKTYILITENDEIFYHVDAGHMNTSSNAATANGIYFTMAENDAPYGGEEYYDSLDVASVQMIRDGKVINIGNVNRDNIQKATATEYFLRVEGWIIGNENYPFTTSDVFIVEGYFANTHDGTTIKIAKTYIYHDGTSWVCSDTAPVQKNIVDVTGLGSHSNGWSTGGFYFTAAANTAPYDTTWALRYKPVSADVIKLIHDGKTTNVGNTGGETIVKYSETEYYIEGWTVGMGNVVAGDQMIIDGQFYNAANDVYIDVEKTTITFNEGGSVTVISDSDKYINAGAMSAYTSNWFGDGIYFAMGSNAAPANTDWTVEYKATGSGIVKLIRNGETKDITVVDNSCIIKITDNQYWLKLEKWLLGDNAPIQDGDVLVIEGEFKNASNGYTLNIDKTYITFVSKESDDVVFSTAADTDFGEVLLPNTNDTLTIGMWNGSYHVFADKQLKELQAAGITKIMGIDTQWIGTTDVNAWLDRVYSYGISVIFDLRGWDGETVPSYASHPGVIGFLMYDEPCATDFDTLADLKAKFDAVMPKGTLFYVNLFPSCAAGTSLVGALDWALGRRDYDQYYVQKFLDKLNIEVLSWDNYSLLNGNGIRTDYFYNFEVMASKNVPMWYTMLSSGHGTTSASYATPTEQELRWQMAVALTYGVQNIDHYTYVSHESDYSCMVEYDTWEPTDLYYDILKVDNEYLAWDNIFMAYNWVGVGSYSANSNNAMLTKLNKALNLADYGVSVSASENLLVGVFDYNGDKAYMVTNAGSAGSTTVGDGKNFTMADTTVTLTLDDADYKCVAIIDQGEISYVAVNADNTVTINVEAYEGIFVIPVLN